MGKHQPKPFESAGRVLTANGETRKDTSANIYMSMLLSEAWMELTANQQRLYLYCKAQYYGQHPKPISVKYPGGHETHFTMNRHKYVNEYGLYTDGNRRSFQKDIEALIEKGFIICIETAYQKSTIYAFSDSWQKYGTGDFKPTTDNMTYSMAKKTRSKDSRDGKFIKCVGKSIHSEKPKNRITA